MSSFAAACVAAVMPLLASPDAVAMGWPVSLLSAIGWKWLALFLGACFVKVVANLSNRRAAPKDVVDKKPRRQWEKPAIATCHVADVPALPSWANRDVPLIQDSILCCTDDDDEGDADDAEAFTLADYGKWLASKGEPVVSAPSATENAAGKCVPVDEPQGDLSELLNRTFCLDSAKHSDDAASPVLGEHAKGGKVSSHSHHVSLPLPEMEGLNFSVISAPGNVADMTVPTLKRMSTPRQKFNRRILVAGSNAASPARQGDVSELLNKTFSLGSTDHSDDAANPVHEDPSKGGKESSHSHHVSLPLPEMEGLNFSVISAPGNVAGMMVPTTRMMSTPRRKVNRRILVTGRNTVTPTRTSQLRAAHVKSRAARDTPARRFKLPFRHSSIS